MRATEIRVHVKDTEDKKLKAFVTVTFDGELVVRDLKLIEGKQGIFVAMPSVKLTERCSQCGRKNALSNKFCSECGSKLDFSLQRADGSRKEEYKDLVHPISSSFRNYLQKEILDAYHAQIEGVPPKDVE